MGYSWILIYGDGLIIGLITNHWTVSGVWMVLEPVFPIYFALCPLKLKQKRLHPPKGTCIWLRPCYRCTRKGVRGHKNAIKHEKWDPQIFWQPQVPPRLTSQGYPPEFPTMIWVQYVVKSRKLAFPLPTSGFPLGGRVPLVVNSCSRILQVYPNLFDQRVTLN
jgi:hypothetical protein